MKEIEEYTTQNGETITLSANSTKSQWEVSCWAEDGEHRWSVAKPNEDEARTEFNRWHS